MEYLQSFTKMGQCSLGSVVDGSVVIESHKRVEHGLIFHDCKSIQLPPGGPDYTAEGLIEAARVSNWKTVYLPGSLLSRNEMFMLNALSEKVHLGANCVVVSGPEEILDNPYWCVRLYFG